MSTPSEVRAYYKGFDQALRLHAYKIKGCGNRLWVGCPASPTLLNDALTVCYRAKTLALEQAEKPETPKFAIVAGEPNGKGVVTAEVRSFTDPGKTYRVAYDVETKRVHCTCEAFNRLTWNVGNPKASDTLSHCKHVKEFLPQLIESANSPETAKENQL